jgi:hypothetical protein
MYVCVYVCIYIYICIDNYAQWYLLLRYNNGASNGTENIRLWRDARTNEVVSKIFRTVEAIYTAVVVARSAGLNRPNCQFRVLMRCFAATEWKCAKKTPRTSASTDLTASPWQRPVSHFRPHPQVSGEILLMAVIFNPPSSPDLAPCDFFPILKNWTKT